MTHTQLTHAISAGLRAIGKTPSALLFIDGVTDWTCSTIEMCGLPVFHAIELTCWRWGTGVKDCPIIPIGRTENEITYQDRRLFADAFEAAVLEEEV